MSTLFGGKPPKQEPIPEKDTAEVQAAAAKARQRLRSRRGNQASVISRNLPAGSPLKATFGA